MMRNEQKRTRFFQNTSEFMVHTWWEIKNILNNGEQQIWSLNHVSSPFWQYFKIPQKCWNSISDPVLFMLQLLIYDVFLRPEWSE